MQRFPFTHAQTLAGEQIPVHELSTEKQEIAMRHWRQTSKFGRYFMGSRYPLCEDSSSENQTMEPRQAKTYSGLVWDTPRRPDPASLLVYEDAESWFRLIKIRRGGPLGQATPEMIALKSMRDLAFAKPKDLPEDSVNVTKGSLRAAPSRKVMQGDVQPPPHWHPRSHDVIDEGRELQRILDADDRNQLVDKFEAESPSFDDVREGEAGVPEGTLDAGNVTWRSTHIARLFLCDVLTKKFHPKYVGPGGFVVACCVAMNQVLATELGANFGPGDVISFDKVANAMGSYDAFFGEATKDEHAGQFITLRNELLMDLSKKTTSLKSILSQRTSWNTSVTADADCAYLCMQDFSNIVGVSGCCLRLSNSLGKKLLHECTLNCNHKQVCKHVLDLVVVCQDDEPVESLQDLLSHQIPLVSANKVDVGPYAFWSLNNQHVALHGHTTDTMNYPCLNFLSSGIKNFHEDAISCDSDTEDMHLTLKTPESPSSKAKSGSLQDKKAMPGHRQAAVPSTRGTKRAGMMVATAMAQMNQTNQAADGDALEPTQCSEEDDVVLVASKSESTVDMHVAKSDKDVVGIFPAAGWNFETSGHNPGFRIWDVENMCQSDDFYTREVFNWVLPTTSTQGAVPQNVQCYYQFSEDNKFNQKNHRYTSTKACGILTHDQCMSLQTLWGGTAWHSLTNSSANAKPNTTHRLQSLCERHSEYALHKLYRIVVIYSTVPWKCW